MRGKRRGYKTYKRKSGFGKQKKRDRQLYSFSRSRGGIRL